MGIENNPFEFQIFPWTIWNFKDRDAWNKTKNLPETNKAMNNNSLLKMNCTTEKWKFSVACQFTRG